MSEKFYISDLHGGHERVIAQSKRPFPSVEEMNQTLIENCLVSLPKGSSLYHLGDLGWTNSFIETFFETAQKKHIQLHIILGNHDRGLKKYKKRCASYSSIKEIKLRGVPTTLCHYPMLSYNKSHYNAFQLYGHHHGNGHGTDKLSQFVMGKKLNVNCEFHEYKPWSEEEIIDYMDKQPYNWDYIGDNKNE